MADEDYSSTTDGGGNGSGHGGGNGGAVIDVAADPDKHEHYSIVDPSTPTS